MVAAVQLLPQFVMVADWSKNLILGMSSKWLASGISVPVDIPFKDHLLPPITPQDVIGKSSSTK
jgi:membrane protein required for colicin V production